VAVTLRRPPLLPLALALGLLVGPENLVTLGRGAGRLGLIFAGLVVIWAAVHWSAGTAAHADRTGEAALSLAARVVVTLAGLTLILARAGYVFNEVFVYWVPNLAFSFCLLVLVAGLNLAWPALADRAQVVYVAVAIGGLLVLAFIGLFSSPAGGGAAAFGLTRTAGWDRESTRAVVLGATLFIGFELALLRGPNADHDSPPTPRLALPLAAVVFVVWGLVSWWMVPAARLAGSTVPYAPTAWRVAGETGQIIIGLVLLASCLAAVNALYRGVSGLIAELAREGHLPSRLGYRSDRALIPGLLLGLGAAALLGLGYAGEPVTVVWLRGGLGLWLLLYAVKSWTRRPADSERRPRLASRAAGLVLAGAMVGLIWTDPDRIRVLSFMAAAWAAAAVLIHGYRLTARRRTAGDDNVT
jgi:hypothetical protein